MVAASAKQEWIRADDQHQQWRRITALACALQRGPGLCVLGAGSSEDLGLPELVEAFGAVHLVDIGDPKQAIAAGPYDVVLSWCALEQPWVPLPTRLLTMTRLLRPNGSAVLVTEVTAGAPPEMNLGLILMLLREHPELSQETRDLRLIEPWTWTRKGAKASAHAVVFKRAA